MEHWQGPFSVIASFPEKSTYTLLLPDEPDTFPTFHASRLKKFMSNVDALFPGRQLERPPPVLVDGFNEFFVDRIVDDEGEVVG